MFLFDAFSVNNRPIAQETRIWAGTLIAPCYSCLGTFWKVSCWCFVLCSFSPLVFIAFLSFIFCLEFLKNVQKLLTYVLKVFRFFFKNAWNVKNTRVSKIVLIQILFVFLKKVHKLPEKSRFQKMLVHRSVATSACLLLYVG